MRSYAWEKDEWEDFWRTIGERALEIDTTDNRHSPVFMGAIVLQEIKSETIGSKEFLWDETTLWMLIVAFCFYTN